MTVEHHWTHGTANCVENDATGATCFYMDGLAQTVRAAAQRHADATGHTIDYEVHQFKWIKPRPDTPEKGDDR